MMIDYECLDGHNCSVNSDCITHMNKDLTGKYTVIHLNNDKTILSNDSIKTLSARINLNKNLIILSMKINTEDMVL